MPSYTLVLTVLVSSIPGLRCCPSRALGSDPATRLLHAHLSPRPQGLVRDLPPTTSFMIQRPFNLSVTTAFISQVGPLATESGSSGPDFWETSCKATGNRGAGGGASIKSSYSLAEKEVKLNKVKSYLRCPKRPLQACCPPHSEAFWEVSGTLRGGRGPAFGSRLPSLSSVPPTYKGPCEHPVGTTT